MKISITTFPENTPGRFWHYTDSIFVNRILNKKYLQYIAYTDQIQYSINSVIEILNIYYYLTQKLTMKKVNNNLKKCPKNLITTLIKVDLL